MQFLTSLFGGTDNTVLTAAFALGIVLVLIVLSVWLLKFVFKTSNAISRGRNRRLALVETMQVDAKRQLVIVRRDDVEHLILVGGPQDVVVEAGFDPDKSAALAPAASGDGQKPPAAGAPQSAGDPGKAMLRAQRGAVERLREFARPKATSLRHTGLMRASPRMEVIPGNLDDPARDSAKTTPVVEAKSGGAKHSGNGIKASGD